MAHQSVLGPLLESTSHESPPLPKRDLQRDHSGCVRPPVVNDWRHLQKTRVSLVRGKRPTVRAVNTERIRVCPVCRPRLAEDVHEPLSQGDRVWMSHGIGNLRFRRDASANHSTELSQPVVRKIKARHESSGPDGDVSGRQRHELHISTTSRIIRSSLTSGPCETDSRVSRRRSSGWASPGS